jgi:hypothetical protein
MVDNMTIEALFKKTPNEILTNLVISKIKAKGFIPDSKIDEIILKIKSGTVSIEDWKLWINLALSEKQKDSNDGKN